MRDARKIQPKFDDVPVRNETEMVQCFVNYYNDEIKIVQTRLFKTAVWTRSKKKKNYDEKISPITTKANIVRSTDNRLRLILVEFQSSYRR